ncbi:DUF6678 family protein [Rhizobium chutanense]|uniref:Uncharacterized protein n=1 Tax=Rhizobium chutanense TaxID=2035448 RepID=A0A432NMF9_9HYPH|nr:DUF6678 family protein [Rhizobium chutanense]RUM00686.1 hypothetical protein EFR84_24380 [Rhizobium chutanense]
MRKNAPVDMRALRAKAKKASSENYTTSLMSNTKWRALFSALEQAGVEAACSVKFIGDDKECEIPAHPGLYPPHAYVDLWPLNVYPLVEIEWIEFRRIVRYRRDNNLPAKLVPQDIDAIRAVIESTRKRFPLEVSEDAIRVVGHVK